MEVGGRSTLTGSPVDSRHRQSAYLSKADFMAALLRELILTGDLKPGEALRQRDLAKRFGMSSTPVREALRRLESEGLVNYDAHRGSTVVEADVDSMQEKFRIRATLEGLAASLAAPKILGGNIRELESYNEQLADPSLTPEEVGEVDHSLHFRVYELAASPLLLALMRLLWQSFPQRPQIARPRHESAAEHNRLIEALRTHDAAGAQAIIQQHILAAIPHLLV